MDESLVEAAQRGDAEAFAALTRGIVDQLFRVAHRILRDADRADDAVQHALVKAWLELPDLRDAGRFEAWLHRIVVHACYDEARRQRQWSASVRLLQLNTTGGPDTTLGVAVRDALERAMRRIPPEQRAVFVLHHHLGWPLAEIAGTLGEPLGTIKSRLHYATAALRAALEADARTDHIASTERLA